MNISLKKRSLLIATLLLLISSACEKTVDWDLQTEETDTIVVEAIITDEHKTQEIKLSKTISNMNDIPEPVSGAKVLVSFSSFEIEFLESEMNSGSYYSEVPFKASSDQIYNLSIESDEEFYEAQTVLVPVYPFTPPPFSYNEELGLYTLYFNTYQYNPIEQSMIEIEIDWSHLPGYSDPDSLSRAKMQYFFLKTLDVSYIVFPQDKEQVYFPEGSIAVFTKYSLTDEYGAFLRALLIESQWQGSVFEGARGNIPGNISNDALGFFTACGILRDTVVVGE